MNLRIPFLTTKPETDLLIVFALTPVWWLTGFNIFVYLLISVWAFLKLLTGSMKEGFSIRFPLPIIWFFIFQVSYMISILINAGLRPAQRVLASFNNYTMLIMGLFMMVVILNSDEKFFLKRFIHWGSRLCILTALIGTVILLLWLAGYKDIHLQTLIYKMFPALDGYPFFTMLLVVTGTMLDTFSFELPRLTIYSGVTTSTGGLVLFLIPLMIADYTLRKKRNLLFWIFLILSLIVLAFSVARAAIVAVVVAFIVITLLSQGKKTFFVFVSGISAFVATGAAARVVDFVLNVRKSSTVGRMNLYEEALRILFEENPLMGVGVRIRDDFTMMAIGSHSLYIEIIFVAGCIGLFLFLFFQFLVLRYWYLQKSMLQTHQDKIVWKWLGMALISMDIWLVTDTIFGPPFTTYGYFMIVGAVLKLGDMLKKNLPGNYFLDKS